MLVADERGLRLTTDNPTAVEHFDTTMRHFLEYRLDTVEHLQQTLKADPEFAMGHCLKGYFGMLASTVAMNADVDQSLRGAEAHSRELTVRERTHIEALRVWHAGDLLRAWQLWDEILTDNPTDVLALRLQHFAIFWTGRSYALRDGVARAISAWDEQTPGYGFVLGMQAFGLEESGDYAAAEASGKRAVELNPEDMWAIHAVAHVIEMQNRLRDGIAWLSQPLDAWNDRNAFKSHLWWHLALYPFELGDYERVLELYDEAVWKDQGEFYIELQNAASLLARLHFRGVDVGTRWQELAAVCAKRLDDHVLPFTDLHVMLALVAAGQYDAAERLLASLWQFAETSTGYAATTMRPVTLPLCEGMLAYGKGDYATAIDRMYPVRYDLPCVGGSHAQRDLFAQLLIDAVLRGERWSLARALLAERVALRPNSATTWQQYAEVLTRLGDTARAAHARSRVQALAGH
jgi:tetratricopeptide (TPR) repeat protein